MSIIRFNVGGIYYSTTKATLEARGENMLSRMVSSDVGAVRDDTGAYFLDRSGRLFELVLEYLRTGKLHKGKHAEALKDELSYYAIEGVGVLLSEVSDKTLRDRIEAQRGEILHKYANATQEVVRLVLEDFASCVEAGGFHPYGNGFQRTKAGGPVFINRTMPSELRSDTSFYLDERGARVPIKTVWKLFLRRVKVWAKSPNKTVFSGDLQNISGLHWPSSQANRHLPSPSSDGNGTAEDVVYLDLDPSDVCNLCVCVCFF